MRKFAAVSALIMMLGASGCNSEMNSEGNPSITQSHCRFNQYYGGLLQKADRG